MINITQEYHLPKTEAENILNTPVKFGFNGFGEIVYYRTYSRLTGNKQETWADTIKRTVEGVMSIRKSYCDQMGLKWDKPYWDTLALELLYYMYTFKGLPGGRSLWAMGTDFVKERGSASLFNCAGIVLKDKTFSQDIEWIMDMLMLGSGVGVKSELTQAYLDQFFLPSSEIEIFTIEDSREGWCKSVSTLIESYRTGITLEFDYSKIRVKGQPIKGFGGIASGPAPLIELHNYIRQFINQAITKEIGPTRFTADIVNCICKCVIAGNVRRSASVLLGDITDSTFLNLKNYKDNSDREAWGGYSNNSVILRDKDDFLKLPKLTKNIIKNGEPGIINLKNIKEYARYGDKKPDNAELVNPCGEIALRSHGVCNLFEVFPSNCQDIKEFKKICQLGALYTTTVNLLATHHQSTNQIIQEDRRIGISLSGIVNLIHEQMHTVKLIKMLRTGYNEVVDWAHHFSEVIGVVDPIRNTTVKPSGTISQLVGCCSGMHFPESQYAIRRIRVANNSPMVGVLLDSGLPCELDVYDSNTVIFEYPIYNEVFKTIKEASAWEQFALLQMLQREWADNSVSCTVTIPKEEQKQMEAMLAYFLPTLKGVSLLPTGETTYPQMPYESITQEEYGKRVENLKAIDWSNYQNDGIGVKFCNNDTCEV